MVVRGQLALNSTMFSLLELGAFTIEITKFDHTTELFIRKGQKIV